MKKLFCRHNFSSFSLINTLSFKMLQLTILVKQPNLNGIAANLTVLNIDLTGDRSI